MQDDFQQNSFQKSHIARRFAKAYDSYRQAAVVQAKMADRLGLLIAQYGGTHYEKVLEIGCGSGLLSESFARQCRAKQLILNDLYEEIRQNTHYLDVEYRHLIGDITTVDLPDGLDLVMSGASLQWVYPLDDLMARLYRACQPKAVLAFSTFGTENLKQIRYLTGQGLAYYSSDRLIDCVSECGWQLEYIDEWQEVLYFNDPMAVLAHLKASGVTATGGGFRWTKATLRTFCDGYQALGTDQGLPLSYHPVLVIAKKI